MKKIFLISILLVCGVCYKSNRCKSVAGELISNRLAKLKVYIVMYELKKECSKILA